MPNAPVTYTTSNSAAAIVTGNSTSATVTATGTGSATITATSGAATAQVQVAVDQRLDRITINVSPMVMGTTAQLTPVALDSRNVPLPNITGFTITTAAPSIAHVDANGVVTAIAPGTASINASLTRNGVTTTGQASFNVTLPPVPQVTVDAVGLGLNVFSPRTAMVDRGSSVLFNIGSLAHNITFQGEGAPANVPALTNASASRLFANVGTFPYNCTLHGSEAGTIVVTQRTFVATMNGAGVRPSPSSSTATGAAVLRHNDDLIAFLITFQGLTGTPTSIRLHAPSGTNETAPVVVDFNIAGTVSTIGAISGSIAASSIQGANGGPAMSIAELVEHLRQGRAYLSVQTQQSVGGEIRGQIQPQ
jgi:plastocyanin